LQRPRRIARNIDFVTQNNHRYFTRKLFLQVTSLDFTGILNPQDAVGILQRLASAANAFGLDPVRVFSQSGSVDQLYRQPVDFNARPR
jgi:hypothetical protein